MGLAPLERQRHIAQQLRTGKVSVHGLAKALRVSEITIRRDLAALRERGALVRVYGGALPKDRVSYEFSFKEKEALGRDAKMAIGRIAASLVKPGMAVFLDTGTTAVAVARALRASRPSTIVTVNLCIASEYVGQDDVRVLIPGGEVGSASPDVYGEWTMERLADVCVDIAFLGCDAVQLGDGYYTADTRSAAVSRLLLDRAGEAYLLADKSKFGRRSMCRVAPLSRLAGIVTEGPLAEADQEVAASLGIDVVCGG